MVFLFSTGSSVSLDAIWRCAAAGYPKATPTVRDISQLFYGQSQYFSPAFDRRLAPTAAQKPSEKPSLFS